MEQTNHNHDYDVVVIGAGPAGATSAGLLAKAGHRVLMLEREHFPRPHIGESLLPAELPVFEALAFVPGDTAIHKSGADFLDERTGERGRFPFSEGLAGTPCHAMHVERANFDYALARHAETLGVVWRHAKAEGVHITSGGVSVDIADDEPVSARYVIDATGRDRLLCKQHKSFERIDGFGVAVVNTHWGDLNDKAYAELVEAGEGNITVLMIDQGWGWIIPIPGQRISVGFVSSERGVVSKEWFEKNVAASAMLQRLIAGATRDELELGGDYSFKNTRSYGSRFACIGDSSAFLDPVFSSGVAFGMSAAHYASEQLSVALNEKREDEPELLVSLQTRMQHAYDVFGALIHSFYHSNMVRNLFFYDDPEPEIRAGFISILAGDVWRDDNKFQDMLLRSTRRRARRQSLSSK